MSIFSPWAALGAGGLDRPWGTKESVTTKRLNHQSGNSPAVQWLGLRALTAKGPGSIPGQGTKIPQDVRHGQK